MVRTDELMIGNWVIVDDAPRQVQSITKKKIGFHYRPNEVRLYYACHFELRPIALTRDLLQQAGFNSPGDSRWFIHETTGFELFYSGGQWRMTVNCAEYQTSEPISYLHELQNLFYQIERKHLNITFNEE